MIVRTHDEVPAMKKILIVLLCTVLCSCSPVKFTQKYAVVGSFGDLVHETDDECEAMELALSLTQMGRVLPSKPIYFVVRK